MPSPQDLYKAGGWESLNPLDMGYVKAQRIFISFHFSDITGETTKPAGQRPTLSRLSPRDSFSKERKRE